MLIASLKEKCCQRILHPVLAGGPGSQLLCYRVGMGREPEEWDVRAGKGLVGGDDFRDMMILELGS